MALTLVASNDRKMTMEAWIKLVKVGEKKVSWGWRKKKVWGVVGSLRGLNLFQ